MSLALGIARNTKHSRGILIINSSFACLPVFFRQKYVPVVFLHIREDEGLGSILFTLIDGYLSEERINYSTPMQT